MSPRKNNNEAITMTDVRTPAAENPALDTTVTTGWTQHDTTWMLGLYGTAIGAGTLFLPINAGVGGFWPLIVLALLAFPMTFFAHRGLTRFVLSGKSGDITEVVEEHFGVGAGKLITLLYFFAIFPILLVYSVALTNTLGSFMEHQLHLAPPPRGDPVAGTDPRPDGHCALRPGCDRQGHERAGLSVRRRLAVAGAQPDPQLERRLLRLRQRRHAPASVFQHAMAGDPGDGVLIQPLADYLRLRRRPEARVRPAGRTQKQRHPRHGPRHDGADGDVLLLQLRAGPVAG
ncbi:membrane hypothetical protein [Pseudomonas marginalis]